MLSQNSRRAKCAGRYRPAAAFITLAASVFFCFSSIGILSPTPTAAQTSEGTQISFTYLKDTDGIGGTVGTNQSEFVRPGVARISVFASFTGRGYGFSNGNTIVPDALGPEGSGDEAQIEEGEAFIVTPIIDPDLYLNYQMHNESGSDLTSLTFTLDPSQELYFFQTVDFPTASTALTGTPLFSDRVSTLPFNGAQREGFKSVTFSSLRGETLTNDGQGIFSLAIHVPEGREGQKFYGVISPNGLQPLDFPSTSAPEPGTLMLVLPIGMALGAAVRVKRLKRIL